MTGIVARRSCGAPLDDARRLAVQAILSGPAGGVSGAAFYGQQVGLSKVIGFDMGGKELLRERASLME